MLDKEEIQLLIDITEEFIFEYYYNTQHTERKQWLEGIVVKLYAMKGGD